MSNYGLDGCSPFYTYYSEGYVYFGVITLGGIISIKFTLKDWIKILDTERKKAGGFNIPKAFLYE